ncbi:hypothetical protein CHS0354_004248 [Potamilus streckersoni]|uniref:Uncharacterized protein n=1 Tax=Potamilus streckersoni TaxID=2493646 RepID=A0AAE0S4N7_9BIVA|nr:hypothetical protein CHS0354_004248 [Potamilus streckersoni]
MQQVKLSLSCGVFPRPNPMQMVNSVPHSSLARVLVLAMVADGGDGATCGVVLSMVADGGDGATCGVVLSMVADSRTRGVLLSLVADGGTCGGNKYPKRKKRD